MSAKKKTPTTSDAVERLPHRYPTRLKLRQDTAMTTTDAVEKLPHDHYYPTSSKLCRNNTPYLPREVIFNILIYIPAKQLFDAMRYVCKQWYDIVTDPDFVRVHCQMSIPGFLIHDSHCPHMIYIEDDTPTPSHATEIQIPIGAEVVSCFNGLVLLSDSSNRKIFHLANPVTKESISLPPLEHMSSIFESGLAVDSCGHYKVACASRASGYSEQVKLRVFTIGIDKAWRSIDLQGIPVNSEMVNAMSYYPQSFGGFIYWFTHYYHTSSTSYGFAMDVDTETIYRFSQPDVGKHGFTFVNMGTSLGYIATGGMWRLWKLTDVKCDEWTELPNIDVSTLCKRFREVFDPCVNMLYKPVKLFRGQLWHYREIKGGNALVRYNFVNDKMVIFPIKIHLNHRTLLPHANTLVSPNKL